MIRLGSTEGLIQEGEDRRWTTEAANDRGTDGRQRDGRQGRHIGTEEERDEYGEPIVFRDSFGRPRSDRSSRSQESDERHHQRRRYESPEGDQLGGEDQCADPQCKGIDINSSDTGIYCRGVTEEARGSSASTCCSLLCMEHKL